MNEMAETHRDEYEAALRNAGITRQAVWHQQTPEGTLALVYIEAESPDGAPRFTSSDADISRWFVEKMQEVHGIDVSQPPPPVNKVHDVQIQAGSLDGGAAVGGTVDRPLPMRSGTLASQYLSRWSVEPISAE